MAHAAGVRIGVVIAAYDAEPWIRDAVASVLRQTYPHWTLVVVDDGSTDGTADAVSQLPDARIRLIRQANAGVSVARNAGLASLSGRDAVLFLDADDWLAPDALSRLAVTLAADPRAVAAVGSYASVDTGVVRRPPGGDLLPRLLVRNLFANGGHLLIRHKAIGTGFRPSLAYGEDWEYWIRIALQGPFAAVPGRAPVLFVRPHAGGAYQRLAADPAAFVPCMTAIFANPALAARCGAGRLAAIRRRTEAENDWIIGRELLRHGQRASGLARLRRSVRAALAMRRAILLAMAHALPMLPPAWRGPFRPYGPTACVPVRAPSPARDS